jgi:Na+/melibiose symporter-like transporter
MLKNKSFLRMLISFIFILGYVNVYGTIINEYFSKYGLNSDQTSYIGGIANVIAIISCLVASTILDKFKNYKKVFLMLNVVGLIFHILMTVLLEVFEDYSFLILLVCWTVCSSTILPIYTCSMDFVVELTYPVGESISGGFVMCCNQITGIIAVIIN